VKHYIPHLALLAALAAAAVLQLFSPQLDDYAASILVLIGINVVLAVSLNLVNGHTGQFSLGHAGFMAAGAYASAMATLSFAPVLAAAGPWAEGVLFAGSLLLGGAVAALCGLLVGLPSLRLRGDYLAIVTLGFGEIIRVVIQNTESLGGARGLEGIRPYTNLFWTFAVAAVTVYVVACLVNSTYGRGFVAVRDDEIAAELMGVHTVKYKVVAFVVGAFFAGLAGALYAHFITFIAPEGFNFLKSVDVVVMVILGGMGSTPGVVAAAILLTLLNEGLRDFEQYRMIVFALLLIVIMIVRPQGLLGNFRGWPKRKAGA
jgi:branched-chain amino acid transport system permease protein